MAHPAKPFPNLVCIGLAVCLGAAAGQVAWAQAGAAAATQNQSEFSSHEEPATFRTRVDLVMVPVVVRDRQGRVVAGLTKDSFRLFDKGKLQEIARFTVERAGVVAGNPAPPEPAPADEDATQPAPDRAALAAMPRRFIGYLFDDVHLELGDLARVREAAERHMDTEMTPTDRAAVFTTSGQGTVDFTDDLGKLHQALLHLMSRPIARSAAQECPDISFYQADLIVNKHDPMALQAAVTETIFCQTGTDAAAAAPQMAQAAAERVLISGEHETAVSLSVVRDVVRRMSAMPGERVLVVVSPGFFTLTEQQQQRSDIIERALRANVVINALNARGLYTIGFDASRTSYSPAADTIKSMIERQAFSIDEDVLAEFAAGTGGSYFHNNNDLAEGFRHTSSTPELYYLLGFQPQNLKLDGSFHGLRVALAAKSDSVIEARRGYFAPTHLEDAAATAKREIEDALFSREEMSDMPVELHTQFFKGGGTSATVAVLAHLDLKNVKFRKADGRNVDSLTVVSALFDRNGNFVTGITKHIDFHLREETLRRHLDSGITVRSSLDAKPGAYLVRLVVRDAQGELMSAANAAVDIP
jgi:VWFA-related protein